MIRIKLSESAKVELEKYRYQSSSKVGEKAFMVLLSSQGYSPKEIAERLDRNPHTVRLWLKRYKLNGLSGLSRHHSSGRPNDLRTKVKEYLSSIIDESPTKYGYDSEVWNCRLLCFELSKNAINASISTLKRAFREMGLSYKRTTKRTPKNTLSKEEKLKRVNEMISEIQSIMSKACEIFFLDESHFSNEPYVIRGWSKKGERQVVHTPKKREKMTMFGALNIKNQNFFWRKFDKGNSDSFIEFLKHIKKNNNGKPVIFILDNGPIHKSGKVKDFLNKSKNIHLFFLPPYSPEYNYIERFWGWLKKRIYGFASTCKISDIFGKIKKLVRRFNNKNLEDGINLTFPVYQDLL